jgi:hypothetical protein
VDAAAVRSAAVSHLQPDRAAVVIVGDRARIADELADLGAGEVLDFNYQP